MITKEQALKDSEHFYDIATQALEYLALEPILRKIGEVELTGSYLYNLMGKADIDFHVYTTQKPTREVVVDLAQEFLINEKVIKLNVVNYTKFPPSRPSSPPGVWIGLKVDVDGELVNFDIWLLRRIDEHKDDFATVMPVDWYNNLSKDQRDAIVYTKSLSRAGELDQEYLSTDIYRAVVLGGATKSEEIAEWINNNPSH